MADDQFDTLRDEREKYRASLVSKKAKERGQFDIDQEMNLDSLQAFLDFYFPNKGKDRMHVTKTRELLDDVMKYNVTMKDLVEYYDKTKRILPPFEREMCEGTRYPEWPQYLFLRAILDLSNDKMWKHHQRDYAAFSTETKEIYAQCAYQNQSDYNCADCFLVHFHSSIFSFFGYLFHCASPRRSVRVSGIGYLKKTHA